jgi:hypothetical protein
MPKDGSVGLAMRWSCVAIAQQSKSVSFSSCHLSSIGHAQEKSRLWENSVHVMKMYNLLRKKKLP